MAIVETEHQIEKSNYIFKVQHDGRLEIFSRHSDLSLYPKQTHAISSDYESGG